MNFFDQEGDFAQNSMGFLDPMNLVTGNLRNKPPISENEKAMTDFIRQLTLQSTALFDQSQPLRQQQLGMFGDVMSGKFDPTTSPMFAPIFSSAKGATESQYNLARDAVLGGTARGGAQTGALGDVEMARAGTMSSLPAQISQGIIQDMMGKAYGSVFPESGASSAQSAMSGFGTMAGIQQNRELMDMQQQQSQQQGLGSILGLVLSMI
jgi:hypothetical protein